MSSSSKVRLGVTVAVAATMGAVVFGVLPAIAQDGLEGAISSETSDVEEVESEDESTESESESESEDSTDDSTGAPEDTFGAWVSERAHELGKDGDGRTFGSETSAVARAKDDDDAVDESDDSESVEESANESGAPNGNGAGNGNGHSNNGKND